ncbi:MAG: hypothetical protein ABJD68_16020 [Nakamurella sp.]
MTALATRGSATTGDVIRIAAVVAGSAAQVLVPLIGPALGQSAVGEVTSLTPSIITPPGWAFSVWGPIFAASAGTAVVQALPSQRSKPVHRSTGWWLAAASAGCASWEFVAQSGRIRATPPILWAIVAASAVAHRRVQDADDTGAARLVAGSNGLLLGWTGLAAAINTVDVLNSLLGWNPRSGAGRVLSLSMVGAAALGVSAVVGSSRRGALPVATTTGWGLSALAFTTPLRAVAGTAGGGLVTLALGVVAAARRTRRLGGRFADLLG